MQRAMSRVPRNNFPIGQIPNYIDYLNANVNNQLNLFNIPHSRHQSSDDSNPGSPASSHGGARTAQPALIPASFNAPSHHRSPSYSSQSLTSPEDAPFLPSSHATGNPSAMRSTTSPYTQHHDSVSPDNHDYRHPGSPSDSVHSDRSASLSVRSGYSGHSAYSNQSGHSSQSGSGSIHSQDQNATQRQQVYQYGHPHDDQARLYGADQGPYGRTPSGPPQHYYRLGTSGFQGVLAPDRYDADDDFETSSPHLSSLASSSTSSTPASVRDHLPGPSTSIIHPPSPSDPEEYLRHQLGLPRDRPVDLWALRDPPHREKPSHPYPNLIKLAIFGSPQKKLTLQEIYRALINRFEWFRDNANEMAWKNSIRHNLSLNKVFVNIPRPITEPGKGSYWRLDLSEGEGYKRPRVRKSRAKKKKGKQAAEAAAKSAEGEGESEGSEEISANSATDDASIDPQLRDQGHIVGEGRVRPPRRAGTTSPYPHKSPSPKPASASTSRQQQQQAGESSSRNNVSELRVDSSVAAVQPHSEPMLPPLPMANQFVNWPQEPSSQYQQTFGQQPAWGTPPGNSSYRLPSFGQPSLPAPLRISSSSAHASSSFMSSPFVDPTASTSALFNADRPRYPALPPRDREGLLFSTGGPTGLPRVRRMPRSGDNAHNSGGSSRGPMSYSPADDTASRQEYNPYGFQDGMSYRDDTNNRGDS